MNSTWDEARINQLKSDKVEESLLLEYKSARSLEKTEARRNEICKDVSAMANSAGGTIIYGVEEDPTNRNLPGELKPVKRFDISKEWLEMVIHNIRPKIDGLKITPVVPESDSSVAFYVVEIPQGSTAHQSTDKIYYRRYNFRSVAMDDHEVRDVMNRLSLPKVEAAIGLRSNSTEKVLVFRVINVSGVFASHSDFHLRFPIYRGNNFVDFGPDYRIFTGLDGFSAWHLSALGIKRNVLFPYGRYGGSFPFRLETSGESSLKSLHWAEYTIFADSMPPLKGKFELNDIVEDSTTMRKVTRLRPWND